MTDETPSPLLLYDGTCGLCARSVQFLLRHEGARHDLRFAPLVGSVGHRVRGRRPELVLVDAMAWVEGTDVRVGSDAVLRAASYLGGGWGALGALAGLFPRAVREACYRLVARHRHRLAGAGCVIATPEQRARFIDLEN